jgi:integrase
MRARTGSIYVRKSDKTIFARVTWVDAVTGKLKQKHKKANSRSHARELIKEMIREGDDHGFESLDYNRLTFPNLADYYEKHYLTEALIAEGRKVSGLRSLKTPKLFLSIFRAHFGRKRLRSIGYSDLRSFRDARLNTYTIRKDEDGEPCKRKIASVNREMAYLRRMFFIAQREGWILRNPFVTGDSLISVADEKKRERIISREEESLLVAACDTPNRKLKHLRAIIICALETGMRQGEIFKLCWSDVDFEQDVIRVRSEHTKTFRARHVPITARLRTELERLWIEVEPEYLQDGGLDEVTGDEKTIFQLKSVKRSFAAVCKLAGIHDLRFHDLRHTAATRLVAQNRPLAEVGRILGHSHVDTTYRYVNADSNTVKRAGEALDAFHREQDELLQARVEAVADSQLAVAESIN